MSDVGRAPIENRLLGMLQSAFPLSREPYTDMGARLGISGDDVIRSIGNLKNRGIVRQISPVLDGRRLGFQSTLVALKVDEQNLEKAEDYLGDHQGISHGYEREHEFNIWVTLSVPPSKDLHSEVINISARSHARVAISLPALRVFKLRTNFSQSEEMTEEANTSRGNGMPRRARLSTTDKQVINGLQHDLPLISNPFSGIAQSLGMAEDELLARSRSLLKRSIIRRYGASINHRNAGYGANAMTCWKVPTNNVGKLGRLLGSNRHVSHCYERATTGAWTYNLFAMVHSRDKSTCLEIIEKMASCPELKDYVVLFSIKEFKKTRIVYRV